MNQVAPSQNVSEGKSVPTPQPVAAPAAVPVVVSKSNSIASPAKKLFATKPLVLEAARDFMWFTLTDEKANSWIPHSNEDILALNAALNVLF